MTKRYPFEEFTTEDLETQAKALRRHIPDLQSKLYHMTAEIKRRKRVKKKSPPANGTSADA